MMGRPLRLKRGEERRLARGHLWVFSNEVDVAATPLSGFEPGELVHIVSAGQRFVGHGYVNPHSLIAARLLSRDSRRLPDRRLLVDRLRAAQALRDRLHAEPYYRLAFGESDLLPGLVVDRYDDVLVIQIGTAGIERMRDDVLAALDEVVRPRAVLWKNDGAVRGLEGLPSYVEPASGRVPETVCVREGGLAFTAPLVAGQKTGWFYDQARNRRSLAAYVKGARVLDVCSYVGAWALTALRHGAIQATCVDESGAALGFAHRNAEAHGVAVRTEEGDAFDVLERMARDRHEYDVVVVDPPAFVKRRKDLARGRMAYRKLNQLAMRVLGRDGLLVSCSCSSHLTEDELTRLIADAGRRVGRRVQVLEAGGQALDHPVHPVIPETRYLKALFCRVTGASD